MVLRRFALFTGIFLLDLISWLVDPINEHLIAGTFHALAGLCLIAICQEEHTSRKIRERRNGRTSPMCPGELRRFDSIRPGSDAMGIDVFSETKAVMEPRGKSI